MDGVDVTPDLIAANDSITYNEAIDVERTSNTSVVVSIESGISVEVTLELGVLSFVLAIPREFEGNSTGLLGNFDGNETNDFVYRDGTMISNDATDREIHNFGQSCE